MGEQNGMPNVGKLPDSMTMMSPEDYAALGRAHEALEHPSFAARLSSVLGVPLEQGLRLLPRSWYGRVHTASEAAIGNLLTVALSSLADERLPANFGFHKVLAMSAGAAGGFFGLPSLLLELPVTSVIMMRAIADVARSEGEDLNSVEARLACMEVFAIGGRSPADDAAETGYYEVRVALALHFSAVASLAEKGGARSLPASVNLIRAIAARFGFVISEKAGAQLVPLVGAAAGALVNSIFVEHFQNMARGHFTVRRLERKYSPETVRAAYETFSEADRLQGRTE